MKSEKVSLITLCGFMGAGKTSIGEILASILEYSFVDLDEEIEREAEQSIRQIFDFGGEAVFRKKERETVTKFLYKERCVVALGGGALQNQAVTDRIIEKSLLVFIECSVSVILQRILNDTKRPLLLNKDGNLKKREILKNELDQLYKKRLPLYRQAPVSIVSSDYATPEQAAQDLYLKIRAYGR